jgi:predicted deacylase
VHVDQTEVGPVLTKLQEISTRESIRLEMLQMSESRRGEVIEARCRIGERVDLGQVLAEIRNLPGVRAARFEVAATVGGRHPNK